MAKDTFYFSHDYNTRNDEKIKMLIRKHGMEGYGIFWSIIEDLYNNANALQADYDGIAYDLRVQSETVKSIINDFGLFVFDGDSFGSLSVQNRIDERDSKSMKARQNAYKRWVKSETNATAMPLQCDSNAIKERKGKENKEKEIKESKVKKERKTAQAFDDSVLVNLSSFELAFAGTPYANAHFGYYQECIGNWARSKNEKRADWIATARNWMLRDIENGKFKDKNFKPNTNGNSKTYQAGTKHVTSDDIDQAFIKRSYGG